MNPLTSRSTCDPAQGNGAQGGQTVQDHRATRRGRGFLQALIVLLIATIIVAIALPVYAAQARSAVLKDNARSVRITAMSFSLDASETTGPSVATTYGGAPGTSSTSAAFAATLRASLANGLPGTPTSHYVNPFSGARSIVSGLDVPLTVRTTAPAVWITDNADFRYDLIPARGNAETRDHLRGTVIVSFDVGTQSVQIFFIDSRGAKSAACEAVSMTG
jgi:hypothetical protein